MQSLIEGLYGIAVLIASIIPSFVITLVPHHNVIKYPEYWYEIIFLSLGFFFLYAINNVVSCQGVLGYTHEDIPSVIMILFATTTVTAAVLLCLVYLIWSHGLGYNYPMPFVGLFILYLVVVILYVTFWNLFPVFLRKQYVFRKRLKYFFAYLFWCLFLAFQVQLLTKAFDSVSKDIQWVVAIVVPFMKETNDNVIGRLIKKASNPGDVAAKFVGKATTTTFISFWMAVYLATSATNITCYILLGINFTINMYLCIQTIRIDQTVAPTDSGIEEIQKRKEEALTELIINETIEIVVPISFICTFTVAFYGPNAHALGIVGNNYWQYETVEDLNTLFLPVLQMASIDSFSALIAGLLLWQFCRINIADEYCKVIKKYWFLLAIRAATCIYGVSNAFCKYKFICKKYHKEV